MVVEVEVVEGAGRKAVGKESLRPAEVAQRAHGGGMVSPGKETGDWICSHSGPSKPDVANP
jgi:hypothetical protein